MVQPFRCIHAGIGLLTLNLLVVTVSNAQTQQRSADAVATGSPVRPASGFTVGVSIDQFVVSDWGRGPITTLSARISGFKADGLGNELTLGIAPESGGGLALADFSLMQGVPIGGSTLLVRGGLSLAMGGGAVLGAHFGLGLALPVIPRLAIRLDAVYRPFFDLMTARLDSFSLGIGLMTLPAISLPGSDPGACP